MLASDSCNSGDFRRRSKDDFEHDRRKPDYWAVAYQWAPAEISGPATSINGLCGENECEVTSWHALDMA